MSMRDRVQCAIVWVLLVGLLIPPAFGQSASVPAAALQITIVGRNGARNDINALAAYEPTVQVEDEDHSPVAGALVSFTTPFGGPSGLFSNGAHTLAVLTDKNGRASAEGLHANNQKGIYKVKVSASFKGARAETEIMQTNVSGAEGDEALDSPVKETAQHGSHMKWILIGAGVVGGAVAGILAAKGGGSGAPTGLTVTPGTGTVGAPPKP